MRTVAVYKMWAFNSYDEFVGNNNVLLFKSDRMIPQVEFKHYTEEDFEKLVYEIGEYNKFKMTTNSFQYVILEQVTNFTPDVLFEEPDFVKFLEEKRLAREEYERNKEFEKQKQAELKKQKDLERKKKQLEKLKEELGE
jgi:hypothetical protein